MTAKQFTAFVLAVVLVAAVWPVSSAAQAVGGTSQNHVAEFVPGEILVQTANDIRFLEMYGVNPYVSVRKLERFRDTMAPRVATPGGVLQAEADDYVVSLPPYMDVQLALDIIGQDPRVTAVSPNFYRTLVPNIPAEDKFFGPPSISAPPVDNNFPNDEFFSQQEWLLKIGWPGIGPTTFFDDGQTRLAIIDGGPFPLPDFAEERYDSRSFNVVAQNSQIHAGNFHGGGTVLIAAETTNNGFSGAGIYGAGKVLFMVSFDNTNTGTSAWLVESINRIIPVLKENGGGSINISAGGPNFSQIELDVIKRAASAKIIIVAAAGNEASGDPIYPAGYSMYSGNVISVGGSDLNDTFLAFSNFGLSVTMTSIASRVITGGENPDGRVGSINGTSAAAPQVAAAAALLFQQLDENGNPPSWRRVKDALIGGGDPLPNPNVRVGETSVRATLTGKRLNIRRALSGQLDPAVLPVADLKVSATQVGQNITVTLDASGSFSPTGRRLVSYVFFPGGEKDTKAGIISLSPIISVSYSALGQKLPSVRVVDEDGMFSVANSAAVNITDTVTILSATLKKGTLKVKATFSDPSSSPASLVVVTADGTLLTPVGGWSRNKKGIWKFLGTLQLPTCGCTTSLRVRLTSTGGGVAEAPL